MLRTDARANLAALAFNVDVQLGTQLLLQEPIIAALADGKADQLKELSEKSDGFWEVLEQLLPGQLGEWADNAPANLANAARAFADSGILQVTSHASSATPTTALRDASYKVKSWPSLNPTVAAGILALCRLGGVVDVAKTLIRSLEATSVSEGESPEKGVKVSLWMDTVVLVLKGLRGTDLEVAASDGVAVPASTTGYLQACAHLVRIDAPGEFWPKFRPKSQPAQIADALKEAVGRGEFSRAQADVVRVIAAGRTKVPWGGVVEQVVARLNPGNQVQGDEVIGLLKTLWELRGVNDQVGKALDKLVLDGWLYHHLHFAASQGHAEARTWLAFSTLSYQPGSPAPPGVGNSGAGHAALLALVQAADEATGKALVDLVRVYSDGGWYFRVLKANSSATPLLSVCLKQIAAGEGVSATFTSDVVIEWWPFLRGQFADGFVPLLNRLVEKTDLVSKLIAEKFLPENAPLYRCLVEAGVASRKEFAAWCSAGLNEIPTSTWTEQLKAEGDLIDLVLALTDKDVQLSLVQPYEDGLVDAAKLTFDGWRPQRLANRWGDVLVPLRNPNLRRTLRGRLYDLVVARSGDIPSTFFDLYGDELADRAMLSENKRAVSQLFTPILSRRNARAVQWLRRVLSADAAFLRTIFQEDEVGDFVGRIAQAVAKDPGDEASADVLEIARILKIAPLHNEGDASKVSEAETPTPAEE